MGLPWLASLQGDHGRYGGAVSPKRPPTPKPWALPTPTNGRVRSSGGRGKGHPCPLSGSVGHSGRVKGALRPPAAALDSSSVPSHPHTRACLHGCLFVCWFANVCCARRAAGRGAPRRTARAARGACPLYNKSDAGMRNAWCRRGGARRCWRSGSRSIPRVSPGHVLTVKGGGAVLVRCASGRAAHDFVRSASRSVPHAVSGRGRPRRAKPNP